MGFVKSNCYGPLAHSAFGDILHIYSKGKYILDSPVPPSAGGPARRALIVVVVVVVVVGGPKIDVPNFGTINEFVVPNLFV